MILKLNNKKMDNLNIEEFSPAKAEVLSLIESVKDLEIKDVNDKDGYKIVDDARKKIKKTKADIKNKGKDLRASAIAFQKEVIKRENELTELLIPAEQQLIDKLEVIDKEKEKLSRVEFLPVRRKMLNEINKMDVTDNEILGMDDKQYNEFYFKSKQEYLDEQERIAKEKQEEIDRQNREAQEKLAAEQKKLEDERRKLEEDKRVEAARKQAAIDAEEKAKKDAEEAAKKAEDDKNAAIKAEKDRVDEEKRKAKVELYNKRKEMLIPYWEYLNIDHKGIDYSELPEESFIIIYNEVIKIKDDAEKKLADEKEKIRQEKLQKQQEYQGWLANYGATEQSIIDGEFIVLNDNKKLDNKILYKKVSEFQIKLWETQ